MTSSETRTGTVTATPKVAPLCSADAPIDTAARTIVTIASFTRTPESVVCVTFFLAIEVGVQPRRVTTLHFRPNIANECVEPLRTPRHASTRTTCRARVESYLHRDDRLI